MSSKQENDDSLALSRQAQGYKEACERLIVLLSASRHELDVLEDKSVRQERPLPALINFAKSIDKAILRLLGVSDHRLAHIVPSPNVDLSSIDITNMNTEALAALARQYDSRFAPAERAAYLKRPKQSISVAYRFFRGLLVTAAVKVFRAVKSRKQHG